MSKHDDKIKDLLAKVESQQSALGVKPKASWNTNGIFKFKDGTFLNLNTIRDPQVLVETLSTLLEKELLHTKASERLGVPVKAFAWDGYTLAEWESDFKRRVEIIAWEERKVKLEETKKKLRSLISEDAKTEMELSSIENLLGP